MSTLEETSTDARSADGYVVIFRYDKARTGVYAVTALPPRTTGVRKLRKAITEHSRLSVQLEGFEIRPRSDGRVTPATTYEIYFAVRIGMEDVTIPLFLEYARQSGMLKDPIVSNIQKLDLK